MYRGLNALTRKKVIDELVRQNSEFKRIESISFHIDLVLKKEEEYIGFEIKTERVGFRDILKGLSQCLFASSEGCNTCLVLYENTYNKYSEQLKDMSFVGLKVYDSALNFTDIFPFKKLPDLTQGEELLPEAYALCAYCSRCYGDRCSKGFRNKKYTWCNQFMCWVPTRDPAFIPQVNILARLQSGDIDYLDKLEIAQV